MKGGKLPHSESPHGRARGDFGPSEGSPAQVLRRQNREFTRDLAKEPLAVEKWPGRPPVSGGWASRPRLCGSDPGERAGLDDREDALRRLVWHSYGSSGKSLGLQRGTRSLLQEGSNSPCSWKAGSHRHKCQREKERATVSDSRIRKPGRRARCRNGRSCSL